ncbi:MAG: ABC transporter ATP-binding protein [Candidatus Promineifilaceae bacterium]|nr:ABC transporter ATP-binding protein [Candidatus Promineifilaceae bacterium]
MSDAAIVASQLTYSYGSLVAVNQISFSVAQGEILGFLGPNGAGKTTTVQMLTGQLRPKQGQAHLLGLDIVGETERVQRQIGVCFEVTNLYEQMSAKENLKLFASLFGLNGFDPDPLLTRVGLSSRADDAVEKYSKGMKRRLMVARSLVNKPRILFLDEPTDGLDPTSADNIRNIILEERERGAAVFLTTHDMHEADRLADRVAFINRGEIVALDTPHNLKQQYGERVLHAQVAGPDGRLSMREIVLDGPNTAAEIRALFDQEQVVTAHTKEASLEDIFMQLTGRGLV